MIRSFFKTLRGEPVARGPGASDVSSIAGAASFVQIKGFARILMWVIAAVFALLFVWAAMAELDTVTHADGRVVPSARLQVVQSLEGGLIGAIHVKVGDNVKQGDLLVSLDATQVGSDYQTRHKQQQALLARVARLKAQSTGLSEPQFPPELKTSGAEFVANELVTFLSKQGEHETQQTVLEAQISQKSRELQEARVAQQTAQKAMELAQDERAIVARMVERGLEPRLELLRLDRVLSDAKGRAEAASVTITRSQSAVQETESRKLAVQRQFRAEASAELIKSLGELRALEEALPALRDRVRRAEMRAPLGGIVNRVLATTVGGVVKSGDPVVEIVPADDQLVVEALVLPKDIAFIHPGQTAKVKLTAYDYSIYGSLDGKVISISADTVPGGDRGQQAFYQVRVETRMTAIDSLGKKLPMIPGMQCQVDIVTGSKTVLTYLTKPLVGVKENAFRER